MNYKRITVWFLWAMVAAGIGYDFWVISSSGTEASISWTIWVAAHQYPVLTFAAGFLCGHLFWTQQTGVPFSTFPRRRAGP